MINLEFPLSNKNILVSIFDLTDKLVYSQRGQGVADIEPGAYCVSFTMGKHTFSKDLDLSDWEGALRYAQTETLEEKLYSKNAFLLNSFSNEIENECSLRLMLQAQVDQSSGSKEISLELASEDNVSLEFPLDQSQVIDLNIKSGDYKLNIINENSYYPIGIKNGETRIVYIDLDQQDLSYEYHQTICKNDSSLQIVDILESIEVTAASLDVKKFSQKIYLDTLNNDHNLFRLILSLVKSQKGLLSEDILWEKLNSISKRVKESIDYKIFLLWLYKVAKVGQIPPLLKEIHPIGFEFSASWRFLRDISLISPASIGVGVFKRRYFDFDANIKISKKLPQKELSNVRSIEEVEKNIQSFLSNLFIISNSNNFDSLIFGHPHDLAEQIISYFLNLPLSIFIDILNELFYDKQREVVSPLASEILGFEEAEIIDFNYQVARLKPDTEWKTDYGFFTNLELVQAIGKDDLIKTMRLFWKYYEDDIKVEALVENFNISLFELNYELVALNDRVKTREELNVSASALQKTYLPRIKEMARVNLDLLFDPINDTEK
ncbi:hypothetical protein [Roseivirga sp. E12]|uniref:hypothetical protein n=1 Tax=Roseivirga sp. E12 TaxID=2819237 RepID=UPI001ABC95B9|nr:hypothetical protein [Roseivirga sp. E12]MBO3697292.1 hypothetical protein [Roseivirga sp. E12]